MIFSPVATQDRHMQHMTTEEVAQLLRTTPETVRYWRQIRKGPASFKIGRRVLYDTDDVAAYIEAQKAAARRAG